MKMEQLNSKVGWVATAGRNPVKDVPAKNEMLDELPMRREDELVAVKRAAWRMFCACITLFALNVALSLTSWQQFGDNEILSKRLLDEQALWHSLELQLEAKR